MSGDGSRTGVRVWLASLAGVAVHGVEVISRAVARMRLGALVAWAARPLLVNSRIPAQVPGGPPDHARQVSP